MEDVLKRLQPELDQAETGVTNVARLVSLFYHELRTQKVPPAAAVSLTQTFVLGMMQPRPDAPSTT